MDAASIYFNDHGATMHHCSRLVRGGCHERCIAVTHSEYSVVSRLSLLQRQMVRRSSKSPLPALPVPLDVEGANCAAVVHGKMECRLLDPSGRRFRLYGGGQSRASYTIATLRPKHSSVFEV